MYKLKPKVEYIERFYPSGTYYWTVPAGVTEVEVFLVGGGGGANWESGMGSSGGGGGGLTKTFRGTGYAAPSVGTWVGSSKEGRDGDAIKVVAGGRVQIIVGAGSTGDGGYSQFLSSNYRAMGGEGAFYWGKGGSGGSGGGNYSNSVSGYGGSDGGNGYPSNSNGGQGHTTRDFGEADGLRNSGGGAPPYKSYNRPGASDYTEGKGGTSSQSSGYLGWHHGSGGGGYGGGAGSPTWASSSSQEIPNSVAGGDGTVLIRYWK